MVFVKSIGTSLILKHWFTIDRGDITSLHPSINHLPWNQPWFCPGFLFNNMKLSFLPLVLPFRERLGKCPDSYTPWQKIASAFLCSLPLQWRKSVSGSPDTWPGALDHGLFTCCFLLLERFACMLFSASLASKLFPFQTLLTHYLIWEVCANLCLTCASLLNFINGIITTHFHSTIPARPEFVKGKMPTRSQVWALAHTGCSERVEMNWTQGTLISIQC